MHAKESKYCSEDLQPVLLTHAWHSSAVWTFLCSWWAEYHPAPHPAWTPRSSPHGGTEPAAGLALWRRLHCGGWEPQHALLLRPQSTWNLQRWLKLTGAGKNIYIKNTPIRRHLSNFNTLIKQSFCVHFWFRSFIRPHTRPYTTRVPNSGILCPVASEHVVQKLCSRLIIVLIDGVINYGVVVIFMQLFSVIYYCVTVD